MAIVGSLVVRGVGFNSSLTLESEGKRMNPAIIEAHQTLTLENISNYILSERVQWEQMEMHFVSKGRLMTS